MRTLVKAQVELRKESHPTSSVQQIDKDKGAIVQESANLVIPKPEDQVTKELVIRAAQIHFGPRYFNLISYEIVK